MGSILTGQSLLPNKIGTFDPGADFKKSLNTAKSQGFNLTKNALSNTISTHNTGIQKLQPTDGVGLSKQDSQLGKFFNEETLNDSGGYPVYNTYGEGVWAPHWTSYNDIAHELGAPSRMGAGLSLLKAGASMFDASVSGGAGGRAVRLARGISVTKNQLAIATLIPRIGTGAAYYMYKGYSTEEAVLMSTGQNINILTAYRLKGILPGKVGELVYETSHELYKAVKDINILGKSNKLKFQLNTYGIGSNILKFKGKMPKGGNWQRVDFTIEPGKIINRGAYDAIKEMTSPYSFFAGKFGISDDVYLEKAKIFEDNFDALHEAGVSATNDTRIKTPEQLFGTKFVKLFAASEEYKQASIYRSSDINFAKRDADNRKKGFSLYGYASKTLESSALAIDDQIRSNRYSIIAMNNYAYNLFKAGEYSMFLKVAPAVAGGNIALDFIDGVGTVGNFLLNGALQVKEPLDDLANFTYINAQVASANIKQSVNYLKTWWKYGKQAAVAQIKANAKVHKKSDEKAPKAVLSHTLISFPLNINNIAIKDATANDLSYARRNIPKDALLTEAQATALEKGTGALVDQQKALLNQIEKWDENFKPSFFFRLTKAGRAPNEQDQKRLGELQKQYANVSIYINNIKDAAIKGNLKYDYSTKSFTFNKQIGKN
jgi:hypothetical protein